MDRLDRLVKFAPLRLGGGRGMMAAMRSLLLVVFVVGCGAEPPPKKVTVAVKPPPADPLFPGGFTNWPGADPVTDDVNGEVRRFYRAPDVPATGPAPVGAVYVKVHAAIDDPSTVTGIDVRRRAATGGYDGWAYMSFDPATRQQRRIDPETCHLCHAAAPSDGTFTKF